ERTFLFEDRDWLQLSPNLVGEYTVGLVVGGTHVLDLPLHAVPDTDVATVRIRGEDESHAHADEWLVALAEASDAMGQVIYGVDYHWTVDNITQLGLGDLYRYQYSPRSPKMLGAKFQDVGAEAVIHSGVGFVDSSNHLGCSYVPGASSPGA